MAGVAPLASEWALSQRSSSREKKRVMCRRRKREQFIVSRQVSPLGLSAVVIRVHLVVEVLFQVSLELTTPLGVNPPK